MVTLELSTDSQVATSKSELYAGLLPQLAALLAEERDMIANAANVASFLYYSLPELNWAGFYLHKEGELVLGPFQGKPACVRIAMGRGVCGTAAVRCETIVVEDVNLFPGHIACDTASRSEIVIPLLNDGNLIGVLDLDSPSIARFDDDDRTGLESVARLFLEKSELN
jgi:GAF domain-containing protein